MSPFRERVASMSKKNPTWTRTRVGRNRVHWVAYDDKPDAEEVRTIDQGYAASLVEADAAARSALAAEGMHRARRTSKGFGPSVRRDPKSGQSPARPARAERPRPREYLYTRHGSDQDDERLIAAHLILKKTAKKVYATRRSCGPDQLGTDDEQWGPNEPAIPLDRTSLERDGSAYAKGYRQSDFHTSLDAAMGDAVRRRQAAFKDLGIHPPCTVEEIKAAYRLRAFEVHPDRGGTPSDFQAVEAAYRRLLREAQAPEA